MVAQRPHPLPPKPADAPQRLTLLRTGPLSQLLPLQHGRRWRQRQKRSYDARLKGRVFYEDGWNL